jgi:hypothetical protein
MNSNPFDTDISTERMKEIIKERQASRQITVKAKENLLTQMTKERAKIRAHKIDEDAGNKIIESLIKNWLQWHGKTVEHDLEIEDFKKKLELLENWIAG